MRFTFTGYHRKTGRSNANYASLHSVGVTPFFILNNDPMVSNALSRRRGALFRPIVCKPSPRPPTVAWPSTFWPIEVEIRYFMMGNPKVETWNGTVGPNSLPYFWQTDFPGQLVTRVTFIADSGTHDAQLIIEGWSGTFGNFRLQQDAIPLVWMVPSIYIITAWTFITPPLTSGKAVFTF